MSDPDDRLLLSVVVPVFNQASSIIENLRIIRERVAAELAADFEVLVISDGSIDTTENDLIVEASSGAFRVFHYDRNLGKGYAVKLGALEARGAWIAFIDADLDLDPAGIPAYVKAAEVGRLDFAIGSKRHADSEVYYPRSRVAASWLFQQLVRLLFQLDVRDTQVGLKLFRREVAEQVLPLLLVKRYAFDIELLAVARAFGFDRIAEMPVSLDYRFTGSGVRSRAVLRALVDTGAIFYRLRILRYYQRRRAIAGAYGWSRPRSHPPSVSVLAPGGTTYRDLAYPQAELIDVGNATLPELHEAATRAQGDVLAILEPGTRPPANLLSATAPYFARSEITAVVFPKMASLEGTIRARAAASIDESRIGAGLGYFRYTPGNVRYVTDFPARSLIVRRHAFTSLPADVPLEEVPNALTDDGGRVLYTPDSVVVGGPQPLFGPHLRAVFRRGQSRGRLIRAGRLGIVRSFALVVAPIAAVAVGVDAVMSGGVFGDVGTVLMGVYVALVAVASLAAGLRHQSVPVAVLTAIGMVMTHIVYAAGLARGLAG